MLGGSEIGMPTWQGKVINVPKHEWDLHHLRRAQQLQRLRVIRYGRLPGTGQRVIT